MLRSQLELNTVSQAEAEAAVATTTRAWTAERVGQAIVSGINSIVTGGYIASLYEALTNTNKYTDAEKATLAALPVPPAAINSFYRRAGNMQLYAGGYDGIVTKYFLLNGIPFLDAWATVGPTGSGADKIHEPLDELPDETAAVLLEMDSTITSNGSAGAIIGRIWAAAGDVLTPTIDGNSFAPFVHKVQVAATSESHGIATQIWVPVEKGTKIWKFYFTKSGPISGFSVQCKLVGFMTD